jgi:hypothetical protein
MRLKTLLITIGALAVLSLIVAVVRRPSAPTSADSRLNQPLVDAATADKATKLRLSDAGKSVEVVRQPDGTWRVPSYHDMPADFSKLSTFVGNLTSAKIQRLVTSSPERIARLEFRDTQVQLFDQGGKEILSITLGKTAESGGRYVRFGNDEKAYLANFQAWLDAEPKNWANSTLVSLKPEDVAKLQISFSNSDPVTLSRENKDAEWVAAPNAENRATNSEKVRSVLSTLTSLRFSDTTPVDDPNAAAARSHQRTMQITTFDNKTVTVALGRKPEEKKIKPPSSTPDSDSGPAALGSVGDLKSSEPAFKPGEPKAEEAKPIAPEYDTVPAGPVFAIVTQSDPTATVNTLMQKRAFQVSDYAFTSLPQNPDELFAAPSTTPEAASSK